MYIKNSNRLTERENKPVVIKGEREERGVKSGVLDCRYKLLHVKQISNRIYCSAQGIPPIFL